MANSSAFRTSHTLLEQLHRGVDEGAWNRLVDLYHPLLKSWVLRHGIQPTDADDLIQEVLVVLLREIPSFKHNENPGAFRTWLRRILVNRIRNHWRKQNRHRATGGSNLAAWLGELEDPQSRLTQIWDREHNSHVVRHLLETIETRFDPNTRLIFRRMVIEGAKGREVALELNLPISTVFDAKSRVMRELRRLGKGLID